ncbi:AsmA-like C-terminal domain-containing protein [Rhizobium sp. RHZ02]|uniref:YhdP family protein n=1 Tax=Rhizobium sp. RHZ02 TaxID=2769306 RepID=UPI00177AFAAB|nr:AsmA-like C-terminal region-containing protein [Rhizobium sp. RHZ02]MBD9454589.1 AsmA-like C-terminal domain-containing protein [Rhizobium sp. RHZ02]
MSAIRGEKITFRKKDIVALHELPSAQAEDPMIVSCPPSRSRMRKTAGATGGCIAIIFFVLAAIVFTVESGIFDGPLTRQAQAALNSAIGPRYRAEVGSTAIRFTSNLRLALEARNVNMIDEKSGQHLSTTHAMRMALDPLQLFRGRIAIAQIEAEDIALDTALLPSGKPLKLDDVRIDEIPTAMEAAFAQLDMIDSFVERGGTRSVKLSGIDIKLADTANGPLSIVVDSLDFTRTRQGALALDGEVAINGKAATLSVITERTGERTSKLTGQLAGVDLGPFTLKRNVQGQIRQGIDGSGDVTISAVRTGDQAEPALGASVDLEPGQFYMDGDQQELSGGRINLAYDFDKQKLEIAKSRVQFGATSVPLTGALIDLDKIDAAAGKGFGIDLLVSGGTAAPTASGEQPLAFDIQATGRYLVTDRELEFPNMRVSSPAGGLFGSLHVRLGDVSPEISFAGQSQQLQTTAVKQLWPFWMASKGREWVQRNLFGGTVTDASISVFIPFGRLDEAVGKGLKLDKNQIRIAFDIADTRMNVAGDIPPIRDMNAHFDLSGPRATISIKSGTAFFPSGRSVSVGEGTFVLPSTYDKPLMAELNLPISGAADAVGELLTYKPIQVLQRAGFVPEDLKGKVSAKVQARIGLISSQSPPPAEWKAVLQLQDLDVAKPFSGRKITGLDGVLNADPKQVSLDGKGLIDGIPAGIKLVEPTDKSSNVQPQQTITATLNNDQREKVLPGLNDIVDGSVDVELNRIDQDRQAVTVDLGRARLSLPWIGWSKGGGIGATATFEASGPADNTELKNFVLKGDGFGANGSLVIGKGNLVKADFDSVKLSSLDDFSVSVKRGKGGFDVSVSGESADARPIIARLKSSSGGDSDHSGSISVRAKLGRVVGFNDEKLRNAEMTYVSSGGRLQTLNFTGVTDSGEAFVAQTKGNGVINVTSGDAGSVSRFADLYQHMMGGLLNMQIRLGAGDNWDGSIDIRRFSLINEQRLHSIVSTPVGEEQRSLNSAVKRNIDTSAQRFQRGFARIVSQNGVVSIENGVVRGDQVGAVFQGTVRNQRGRMDMTGTFMPAYGLNRLFAELPLIGIILGNGTDRGLIGITFKLTGKLESPDLIVNPLSIIAPGVFRNIFEFQ